MTAQHFTDVASAETAEQAWKALASIYAAIAASSKTFPRKMHLRLTLPDRMLKAYAGLRNIAQNILKADVMMKGHL